MFERLFSKAVAHTGNIRGSYWTFSTVGQSDLPFYEEGWCADPNQCCFYPLPSGTYTRLKGQVRSDYGSQHGVAFNLWDCEAGEWVFIGSVQSPGDGSWISFDFSVSTMDTASQLLIYTTLAGVSIDVRNGELYYLSGEGNAEIISVYAPPEFIPGDGFVIAVTVKNASSNNDTFFVNIYNDDTGDLLRTMQLPILAYATVPFPCYVTLTQTTDFHGLVEAGHLT